MKASIATSFHHTIPFGRAISLIRQAGFEVVSLGGHTHPCDYITKEGKTTIEKIMKKNDITIDSVHAPFPEGDRLFSLDHNERLESIRQCQLAIDAAAELDGKIVVIHLIQPYGIPHGEIRNKMIEVGRQSVDVLVAHAADRDVKLALENGQKRDYDDVLVNLLAEFTEPHIGFCYDSGHEHVQGACFRLLEEFGHRLFTVHIHDNKGTDTHMLPYEGTIDWELFRKTFHKLNYAGNLNLEAGIENSQFKDPAIFLKRAKECAEKLLS